MGTSVEAVVEVWSESCVICEGRAFSGGNTSSEKSRCWECKSVFTELTSSNKAFRCTDRGCCPITRLTRFHCLYCFVKKCLRSGCATGCIWHQGLNNSGSFAPAQNPSSEPAQIVTVEIDFGEQSPQYLASSEEEVEPLSSDHDNSSFDIYNTICRVVFSHVKFCPTTEEKMRGLSLEPSPSVVAIDEEEAEEETLVPGSSADGRRFAVFRKLADNMNSTIVSVVEFLQRLPGYERVLKDEKTNLLKGGYFKVWLLWSVPGFLGPSRQRLILNEKFSLTFSELSDVYSVEFVRGLFDFAQNWSSLGLKDAEVGLCAGIVLSTMSQTAGISWDCTGHIIQETNELLKRALHQLLMQNHPTKLNLADDVLQLVSILDSISYAHSKFLQRFHNQWRHLGVAPLFAEVFSFPRLDESGNEIVSSIQLGDEDMSRDEAEILENEVNKEVAGSPSDLSNQAEDIESCSELGNLGDVSSNDLMSNISNESESELGNYGEPLQSDLCTVEEILQGELSKGGEIFADVVNEDEDMFSREFNIFQRELLSQDEDIFRDNLSRDIFQRELSNDEIIFPNELSNEAVHIELIEDGDVFQSESRDVGDMSFLELNNEHISPSE